MTAKLKEVSRDYLTETHVIKPGDRLHRLVSRLADTYYDDLSEDRIVELELHADTFRLTHADGLRLATEVV